jgi:hypothetical protein
MFPALPMLFINQQLLSLNLSCSCYQEVLPCLKLFQGWSLISCFIVYTYLAAAAAAAGYSFVMFQALSGLVISQLLLSLHLFCCCCLCFQVVLQCLKLF